MKLEAHRPGWVYVLTNSAMAEDIVKIGLTQVDCHARMRAIAVSHKLPGEWRLEHHIPVLDAFAAEQAVHRELDAHRLRWEFFRLPVMVAIAEVNRITTPWICAESEVLTPAPIPGMVFQIADRAARAKAAALKAVLRRRRRAGARKAVETRQAREAAGADTQPPNVPDPVAIAVPESVTLAPSSDIEPSSADRQMLLAQRRREAALKAHATRRARAAQGS